MNIKDKLRQFIAYYDYNIESCDYDSDSIINDFLKAFPDFHICTDLTENGELTISPSNHIEAYALKSWLKSFKAGEGAKIIVKNYLEGLPEVADGVTIVEKVIEKIIVKEKNPTVNNIDTNKERKSKSGIIDILPDTEILQFLTENKLPMTTRSVLDGLKKSTSKSLHVSNVQNSLERLSRKSLVHKETNVSPILWHVIGGEKPVIKKNPKQNSTYATDNDRVEFAKELGFKTIDGAVGNMGSWEFEKKLKEHLNSK